LSYGKIEFDPNNNTVHWHAMDLDRDTVEEDIVPLHDAENLQALVHSRKVGGSWTRKLSGQGIGPS
jgi:hypothetical protein